MGSPLHKTKSVVRSPITRADFPRTNSMGSGFFFCGIMLLPVDTASLGVRKPNSSEAHSTHSSARRDRWIAMMEFALSSSIKKSRSATASTLRKKYTVSITMSKWQQLTIENWEFWRIENMKYMHESRDYHQRPPVVATMLQCNYGTSNVVFAPVPQGCSETQCLCSIVSVNGKSSAGQSTRT